MRRDSSDPTFGTITPDELYTLRSFKQRLGITDATLRAARRAGLRVIYRHKQGFIYGRDWIDYILNSGQDGLAGPTSGSV